MQLRVLRRIDIVDAACEDGDGAMLQCRAVRGRVDAAGEARCDDEALQTEIGGELPGELLSDGRAVACADDRHDWKACEIASAFHVEEGRRRIDMGECRRISSFAHGHQHPARAFGGVQFRRGILLGIDADGFAETAA